MIIDIKNMTYNYYMFIPTTAIAVKVVNLIDVRNSCDMSGFKFDIIIFFKSQTNLIWFEFVPTQWKIK
jgi:hypothetical protein